MFLYLAPDLQWNWIMGELWTQMALPELKCLNCLRGIFSPTQMQNTGKQTNKTGQLWGLHDLKEILSILEVALRMNTVRMVSEPG